jgi:hypothetical protein
MTKFLSFIAIAAFALSASSAQAANKKPHVQLRSLVMVTSAATPVQTSAPIQIRYPEQDPLSLLPHLE